MTVSRMCAEVGISRQAYYKGRRVRRRKEVDEKLVVELVQRERQLQPRLGTRKLKVLLDEEWAQSGVHVGRDRLFEVLRAQELLVPKKKPRGVRTTNSGHGYRKYDNLLQDMIVNESHQAWVSDLTYVRTLEGWLFVSLISDVWSHKIVGYADHETLEARGCVQALEMALGQLPASSKVVHHSDRGVQYCCWEYVQILESHGVTVSMTEENHCYENAQAERLNGILKQEYGLGETLRTKAQARALLKQAVYLYNTRRPHMSLNYRIPARMHESAA